MTMMKTLYSPKLTFLSIFSVARLLDHLCKPEQIAGCCGARLHLLSVPVCTVAKFANLVKVGVCLARTLRKDLHGMLVIA